MATLVSPPASAAAAVLGMAVPLVEILPRPLHVEDVITEVGTSDRTAEDETTSSLPSSGSGDQRDREISLENSSGTAVAASSSSEVAVPEVILAVKALEDLIGGGIQRANKIREVPREAPCIWRVPSSIKGQETGAYEPMLVSIGPLHHGKENLSPMEEIKLMYLADLLKRDPSKNKLSNYVAEIYACQHRAREQYSEEVKLSKDEFVEMLVVDGCFILEYLAKRVFKETKETAALSSVRWGFSHLRRDLMLLENQIPFFILLKLFKLTNFPFRGTRKEPLTLMDFALGFLKIKLPKESRPADGEVLHLLHLHHICLNPERTPDEPTSYCEMVLYLLRKASTLILAPLFALLYLLLIHKWPWRCITTEKSEMPRMIPCATELREDGVKFEKKEFKQGRMNCYLKVSFARGTLEIPFLSVQETTSSELRNFIALEQCCPQVGSYFTSYGVFMDNIINTGNDVAVLRKRGIIESKLGTDKEVANLFNSLCKGVHLNYQTHYNAALFKKVKDYSEVPRHRWHASLMSTYFSTPWKIIALLVAIGILGMQITLFVLRLKKK